MAISLNIQHKKQTKCFIGTEVTMGTATLLGGAWHQADLIDYSIAEKSAPLEIAPPRSGVYAQGESMAKHRRDQQIFEIELQMYATAGSLNRIAKALFEDSSNPLELLGSSPVTQEFDDGQSNTVPVTLLFDLGGHSGNDIWFTSCLCNKMTITGGIGDGGAWKLTASFTTAYEPTEGNLTPSSSTNLFGDPFNFHDLTTHTVASEDLLLSDFSLDISRSVGRVGYVTASNYKPLAYTIGQYEVTGSFTCKRDSESVAIPTNTSTGVAIDISDGTFEIDVPDAMISDVSTDTAEDGWKSTYNFRGLFNDTSLTNAVVVIHTA